MRLKINKSTAQSKSTAAKKWSEGNSDDSRSYKFLLQFYATPHHSKINNNDSKKNDNNNTCHTCHSNNDILHLWDSPEVSGESTERKTLLDVAELRGLCEWVVSEARRVMWMQSEWCGCRTSDVDAGEWCGCTASDVDAGRKMWLTRQLHRTMFLSVNTESCSVCFLSLLHGSCRIAVFRTAVLWVSAAVHRTRRR